MTWHNIEAGHSRGRLATPRRHPRCPASRDTWTSPVLCAANTKAIGTARFFSPRSRSEHAPVTSIKSDSTPTKYPSLPRTPHQPQPELNYYPADRERPPSTGLRALSSLCPSSTNPGIRLQRAVGAWNSRPPPFPTVVACTTEARSVSTTTSNVRPSGPSTSTNRFKSCCSLRPRHASSHGPRRKGLKSIGSPVPSFALSHRTSRTPLDGNARQIYSPSLSSPAC